MLVVDVHQTTEWLPSGQTTHPTWVYGDKQSHLESYLREQLPFVAIAGVPIFAPPFIEFYAWLGQLQDEYPDTKIHLHGGTTYRQLFGTGVGSADYDPMEDVHQGRVRLPCGKVIGRDEWPTWGKWFRMIGYDWRKINNLRDRCEYSIAAAYWAAEFFRKEIPFSLRDHMVTVRPGDDPPIAGDFVDRYRRSHSAEGDKVICDACSLAPHCKLYREGAVCTLNDSPTKELARLFSSRDSSKILEGMGKLLEMQIERLEEGRGREKTAEDGLDDKVTKLTNDVVNQAAKLAKLVNPALTNPKLQIQIGLAQINGGATPPNQLAAAAIAELERRGHSRESITTDMVESVIREMVEPPAIEAHEVSDATE
jgi:hypothetical protein